MRICSILIAVMVILNLPVQALQIQEDGTKDTLKVGRIINLEREFIDSFDSEWIENVRLGLLRFDDCAAAFVSADGLAVTTASCLRSLETWIRPGDTLFVAQDLSQEHALAGFNILQLIDLRKIDRIVDESNDVSDISRVDVIASEDSSYYWEYSWKIYDDVRLVMIPPVEISNFGNEDGVYPRHALDFALFRVYDEDGIPLETESYFAWSDRPPYTREALYIPMVNDDSYNIHSTLSDTFDYNGTTAPPYTTLYGMLDLYHSHGGTHDWTFPSGWNIHMSHPDLSAVLNFSVAGQCPQYGGPIIDIDMELLGIIFDNVYPEGNPRCVAVSTSGILELIETAFDSESLAEELAHQMRNGGDQYE